MTRLIDARCDRSSSEDLQVIAQLEQMQRLKPMKVEATVTVTIKGQSIALTLEEARDLRIALDSVLQWPGPQYAPIGWRKDRTDAY